jgi:hypothetical protein
MVHSAMGRSAAETGYSKERKKPDKKHQGLWTTDGVAAESATWYGEGLGICPNLAPCLAK